MLSRGMTKKPLFFAVAVRREGKIDIVRRYRVLEDAIRHALILHHAGVKRGYSVFVFAVLNEFDETGQYYSRLPPVKARMEAV